jgi:hypothetical protein
MKERQTLIEELDHFRDHHGNSTALADAIRDYVLALMAEQKAPPRGPPLENMRFK